jgi:hypothetical protein
MSALTDPNFSAPFDLWSEILPGLWQGGTADDDWLRSGRRSGQVTKHDFDSVFTFFGEANPADYGVHETRFAFYDGDMSDFDVATDILPIVEQAHRAWRSGKRVLIRCQAGLNRSGLVMALVLMRDGLTAQDAIELIRKNRCNAALCNATFAAWLTTTGGSPSIQRRLAA